MRRRVGWEPDLFVFGALAVVMLSIAVTWPDNEPSRDDLLLLESSDACEVLRGARRLCQWDSARLQAEEELLRPLLWEVNQRTTAAFITLRPGEPGYATWVSIANATSELFKKIGVPELDSGG